MVVLKFEIKNCDQIVFINPSFRASLLVFNKCLELDVWNIYYIDNLQII